MTSVIPRTRSADDRELWRDREKWLRWLVRINNGPVKVRKGASNAARSAPFRTEWNTDFDHRVVLDNEVVFDVDEEDWGWCVAVTHALWDVLEEHDVGYLGALSAGKGTHTHVFLRPSIAWYRPTFYRNVAWLVEQRIGEQPPFDEGYSDPGGRQIRAFGSQRGSRFKKLVVEGPGQVESLMLSRQSAYSEFPVCVPTQAPLVDEPIGIHHTELGQALGKRCPVSTSCLPHPPGACNDCPLNF